MPSLRSRRRVDGPGEGQKRLVIGLPRRAGCWGSTPGLRQADTARPPHQHHLSHRLIEWSLTAGFGAVFMQFVTKREGQDRHLVDHRQLGADRRQPDNPVSDPRRGRQAQCRFLRQAGGLTAPARVKSGLVIGLPRRAGCWGRPRGVAWAPHQHHFGTTSAPPVTSARRLVTNCRFQGRFRAVCDQT